MSIQAGEAELNFSLLQKRLFRYLVECAVALDVDIAKLPEGHSLGTDAVALFNYAYLRKIFDVNDGENVMPRQLINSGIEQFDTWTCHDRVSGKLVAFIIFGRFKMYEDWPTWQKKNMPPNAALLELKMLAAMKGYGRIMFALALTLSMNRGYQGAVLEVLGGQYNYRAIEMYKDFGFEHQKVYDPDQGPYVQLRDRHGAIIFMMSFVPKDSETLLSMATLKEVLDKKRLKRSAAALEPEISGELKYVHEEERSFEEIVERERQSRQPPPKATTPKSKATPEDPDYIVERQKLDDLLASGFIFEEEYEHRLESLKAAYAGDKRTLA